MPFEVFNEDENKVVRVRFVGVVNARDLADLAVLADKIESNPICVSHRLCNLSDAADLDLRFQDLIKFARRREGRSFANSFKSAIVATHPVQIGFARMFQTLTDHPQVSVRIFPTEEEARAWLNEPS